MVRTNPVEVDFIHLYLAHPIVVVAAQANEDRTHILGIYFLCDLESRHRFVDKGGTDFHSRVFAR